MTYLLTYAILSLPKGENDKGGTTMTSIYNAYLNRIFEADSNEELSSVEDEIYCAWKDDRLTDDEAEDLREQANCMYE